jgi:hypothetical protein
MRIHGLVFTLLAGLLTGCGSGSDMVTLTISPNIGNHSIHRLTEDFFSRSPKTHLHYDPNVANCLQKNLFVGVKLGGDEDDNSNILTYPIKLRTEMCTGACSGFDIFSFLADHSTLDEPIKVGVPKGTTVEVGILGTIVLPTTSAISSSIGSSSNASCGDLVAANEAAPNYSVIGHRVVPTNANQSIPLNTWVVQANAAVPASTPYPSGGGWNPGSFYCPDANIKEQCSYRDLIHLSSSSTTVLKILRVEYFFGKNRSEGAKQSLPTSSQNNAFFVPSIFPMKVVYLNVSTNAVETTTLPHSGRYYPIAGNTTDSIVAQELGNTAI